MLTPQLILSLGATLVVDLFAGGGGASTGIEQALGRHVDIAINHDADAIAMHEVNHPQTRHLCTDVWDVCPLEATGGRPVGLLHASPDCTDHSQAKGGQPRKQAIRSLAWVVHRWAGKTRPTLISVENVPRQTSWARLVAKRDKETGRVVTLDEIVDPVTRRRSFRVADPGEYVPRHRQYLVPDPGDSGSQWRRFVKGLEDMGYVVEWRTICNADLGAHSTRTRLYVLARCDGQPIVWPAPTHAKKPTKGLQRHRPASDCIDWSVPGRSIFDRPKPLADASLRRIAYGIDKYVLRNPNPFIVPATHQCSSHRTRPVTEPLATVTGANRGELMLVTPALIPVTHSRDTAWDPQEPLRTITTAKGGEVAVSAATLVQLGYGERRGQAPRALDIDRPLGTVVAGGRKHGLATACLVQAGHGEGTSGKERRSYGANDVAGPIGTVTATGSGGHRAATAFMVQANGGFNATPARDLFDSMSVVTTSGSQQQLIETHLQAVANDESPRSAINYSDLSEEDERDALRCAAFLMRYHGSGGQWSDLNDPSTTITTRDRLALVTVWLRGEPWVIVDIWLRMLLPRELYNAQDFPASYVIDRTSTGRLLTKTAQIRMCGNSVSPVPLRQIIEANYSDYQQRERVAA